MAKTVFLTVNADTGQVVQSFSELKSLAKDLRKEIENVKPGSIPEAQFNGMKEKLKLANTEIANFNQQLKQTPTFTQKIKQGFDESFANVGIAAGVVLLIEKLGELAKASFQAFAERQASERQLLGTLGERKDAEDRLLNLAKQFSQEYKIKEDVLISAEKFLSAQGRTELQIKKTLQAAIQLSSVTGEDLNSSVQKLDGTYEGHIGRLGKIDASITKLSKEQLANGEAIDLINEKYKNFAQQGVEGVLGTEAKWAVRFQNIKEGFGEFLSNVLTQIDAAGSIAVGLWRRFFPANNDATKKEADSLGEYYNSVEERLSKTTRSNFKQVSDDIVKQASAGKDGIEQQIQNIENARLAALTNAKNNIKDEQALKEEEQRINISFNEAKKKLSDTNLSNEDARIAHVKDLVDKYKAIKFTETEEDKKANAKKEEYIKSAEEKIVEYGKKELEAKNEINNQSIQIDRDNAVLGVELAKQTAEDKLNVERNTALEEAKLKFKNAGGKFNSSGEAVGNIELVKEYNKEKLSITNSYNEQIEASNLKFDNDRIQKEKELELKHAKENLDLIESSLSVDAEKEKSAIIQKYITEGNITKQAKEKLGKDLSDVDAKYNDTKIEEEKSYLREQIALGNDVTANQIKLDNMEVESDKKKNDAKVKQADEASARTKKIHDAEQDAEIEALQMVAQSFVNNWKQAYQQQSQEQINALNTNTQTQLDALDVEFQKSTGTYKQKTAIELKYDADKKKIQDKQKDEERKIKTDEAKKDKEAAIINSIINTAVAVVKALSQFPGVPFTIPFGILAGALGAVQTGIIAAQPIPEFAFGSDFSQGLVQGNSHQQDGIDLIERRTGKIKGNIEGNEILLTKGVSANPRLRQMASALNVAGGGRAFDGYIPKFDAGISFSNLNSKYFSSSNLNVNNQIDFSLLKEFLSVELSKPRKAYVVESEITDAQNRTSTTNQRARFN